MAKLDITGRRFGRLVALRIEPIPSKYTHWRCKCDCGNESVVAIGNLRKSHTQSCGCYMRERISETSFIHGQSVASPSGPSRLYRIWCDMRHRCNNKANPRFPRYGGRGIVVCAEWGSFVEFERWGLTNGYRDGLSIDRIDNDGAYSPGNCRWSGAKEQARNRASNAVFTYRGKTACIAEHAEDAGLKASTVRSRINESGWSIERALETPTMHLRDHPSMAAALGRKGGSTKRQLA